MTLSNKRRKRQKPDDDSISLHSVDLNLNKDSKKKKRLSLQRSINSISNLFSSPKSKVSNALNRSISLKSLVSPAKGDKNTSQYKLPPKTPTKRRQSVFWVDTVKEEARSKYSSNEIERQEAIYEVYKTEEELVEDLKMVIKTYRDSMKQLGLLTNEECHKIFGDIDEFVPVHENLVSLLKTCMLPDGSFSSIGVILKNWVRSIRCYVSYCSNEVYAHSLLDEKRSDPAVLDFLQRCQESPFSRKLDLWSFLDVPRSRVVKYPLLFKAIQKATPPDHKDTANINEAVSICEDVITEIDRETGIKKCEFTRDKLDYLEEGQKECGIEESKAILCDGVLKNSRGTKLTAFLFEKVLVLTRPATRNGSLRYQVYRQPIPCDQLCIEDIPDGQVKAGSFRTAFSSNQTTKNVFRVSFRDSSSGQGYSLQALDEHDKRQWLQCLRRVLPARGEPDGAECAKCGEDDSFPDPTLSLSFESECSFSSDVCSLSKIDE